MFLGEWCKLYGQKHVWSKMDYETLPYHWDDRAKLYKDSRYLDRVYERFLPALAGQLNEIHQVGRSTDGWRIIIGPWIYYFISVLYDRYLSICNAIDSGKVTQTWVPQLKESEYAPRDFTEFEKCIASDEYNQILYGRLIEALGGISFVTREYDHALGLGSKPASSHNPIKRAVRKTLDFYGRLIPSCWNGVVMVMTYLKPWDLVRLQSSLGQLPYPCSPEITVPDCILDLETRKKLRLPQGENRFEELLAKFIGLEIPVAYLEGYSKVYEHSKAAYPRFPKAIFTANGFLFNEGFKFWVADQIERGVPIVATQHGGHYGTGLWSANETHEIKVSSRYFTWGWGREGQSKVVPVVSGQLSCIKRKVKPNPKGQILWMDMSPPRYSYWMYSCPAGPQALDFITDQQRFWNALSNEARELLLLRLHPAERGWNMKKRWKDFSPSLTTCDSSLAMAQQMSQSRLCIGTYNATTYLESFTTNIPTLIFWNREHWELRPEARPYFEELSLAGIYYHNPESAAAKVNEIYRDPVSWWEDPGVQNAKNNFCDRFAKTKKDWIRILKDELLKVKKG
mgnify:CR=1 FL=1